MAPREQPLSTRLRPIVLDLIIMLSGARESVATFTLAMCGMQEITASAIIPRNRVINRQIASKSRSGIAVTGFVLKGNLSDNGDIIAGSSQLAKSHGTSQLVHSLNEMKVGTSVPIIIPQVPQVFIDSNNPPLAGIETLNHSKVDVKKACSPPARLTAGSGAGTINGDFTVPCVHWNVGAFDISVETC